MNKLYLGLDVGTYLTKGIIIDEYNNIIASGACNTEGSPIRAVKKVISGLCGNISFDTYQIVSVGVTGFARKLIGSMLDATVIKNELVATTIGTVTMYPGVKTIFEIGGRDAKVILVDNGKIIDYAINNSCMSSFGSFINTLANKLNVDVTAVGKKALSSDKKDSVFSRCPVFLESELIDKIKLGYTSNDILALACNTVANGYVGNILKGKKIQTPIVFVGGVSKNEGVVDSLRRFTNEKINVLNNGQFAGALGVAIMAREKGEERIFKLEQLNYQIETRIKKCTGCANKCEMILVYKNLKLADYWGNRCDRCENILKEGNLVV